MSYFTSHWVAHTSITCLTVTEIPSLPIWPETSPPFGGLLRSFWVVPVPQNLVPVSLKTWCRGIRWRSPAASLSLISRLSLPRTNTGAETGRAISHQSYFYLATWSKSTWSKLTWSKLTWSNSTWSGFVSQVVRFQQNHHCSGPPEVVIAKLPP